jgi:8-oxo-dGTP pyrophosphatase MutT (NUDIX family)
MDNYCNNCCKSGHAYHQCKNPITSIGAIAFRIKNGQFQYLMICRKDTLGFIDFMRGKYSIYNKKYLINMFKQMTNLEKERILKLDFNELWKGIWGANSLSKHYKSEECISRDKFVALKSGIMDKNNIYNLESMIEESNQYGEWCEPEWGFPKGRRNFQEKDYKCAFREFAEETGYNVYNLKSIQNLLPFEEIFTGSNYKSYLHKYYLTFIAYEHTLNNLNYEKSEVSKMEWKSYEECLECIRPYNLEKKRLISNIHNTLQKYKLFKFH